MAWDLRKVKISGTPNSRDKYMSIPATATADLGTPAGAAVAYDTTTDSWVEYNQDTGAWANWTAASATADGVYNAGAWSVTVDANDVAFTLATGYNLLINAATAGTTACGLEINDNTSGTLTDGILFTAANSIVDALDASAANITNAINIGANAIAGTNFSVDASGNVICVNLTPSGTVAISSLSGDLSLAGDMIITAAETTGSGLYVNGSTITSGNVIRAEADAVALNGGLLFNGTIDNTSVFSVGEDGKITVAGTAAGSDALILTAGDATLTSGHLILTAGNVTLTNGNVTLSSGGLDVTAGAGDGDAIDIVNLAANAALDINAAAASVAAGGLIDVDVSTGSAPIFACNASGAYTGTFASLDLTNAVGAIGLAMTGAGTRTVALISVTDVPTTSAPTIDLNLTPGAAIQAGIDIDVAGTTAADIITIDFSAAHTGSAFLATMANAVGGTAFEAVGSGTRTAPLVTLTDTGDNGGITLDINSTKSHATGAVIDIDEAGTASNDMLSMDFSAAFAGDAINITMTNCAAAAQALVVDGSLANSGPICSFSTSGISTAAGSILSCTSSTQPGAANVGVVARLLETGTAQATTYVLQLDSTNNEALNVSAGKCHFVEACTFLASNKEAIAANYVQAGGSANAITVASNPDDTGTNIPLADGLRLIIDLNTLTLQAGANTLNYISGGAVSITKHTSVAANIGTAYAANSTIELVYSAGATAWLDMSQ